MKTEFKRALLEIVEERLKDLKKTAQTTPFIALIDDKGDGHTIPEFAIAIAQKNKDAMAPLIRKFGKYLEETYDVKVVNAVAIFQAYMQNMHKDEYVPGKTPIPSEDSTSDQKMLIKIEDETGYTIYSHKIIYNNDKEETCVVQERRQKEFSVKAGEIDGRAYFDNFM